MQWFLCEGQSRLWQAVEHFFVVLHLVQERRVESVEEGLEQAAQVWAGIALCVSHGGKGCYARLEGNVL